MDWDWDEGEPEAWEVQQMWEDEWETGNLTWLDDMVTTAQEYDKLTLTAA